MRGLSFAILAVIATLSGIRSTAAEAIASTAVRSYVLDVTFLPDESSLAGRAEIEFEREGKRAERLVFYLHGELAVESVTAGGQPVEVDQRKVLYDSDYSMVATRVELRAAIPASSPRITVEYSGVFHPSRARSPSDYMRIDEDGVLLRSYGYSLWFPVFLEDNEDSYPVSFSRVSLRVPADYIPVFSGTWIEESVEGHLRVSEWRADSIDLFDAQCTALRFAVTRDDSTFVYSFRDPGSRQSASRIAELAHRLARMFHERYRADVNAGQLHLMQMPRYGDISSGNVIGLTSDAWNGIEQSDWSLRLLGHELVHAYVQTRTERSDPFWSLAIEGFPSYFHLPVLAEIRGAEFYDRFLDGVAERYLTRRRTGKDRRGRPLPEEKPLLAIHADDMSTYKDTFVLNDRALLLLDWIRRQTGPETFYDFTRQLFRQRELSRKSFETTVLHYLPDAREELRTWLDTTDYPERLRRGGQVSTLYRCAPVPAGRPVADDDPQLSTGCRRTMGEWTAT